MKIKTNYERFIKPIPKDFWNYGLNPITGLPPSKVTGHSDKTIYGYKLVDKREFPKMVKI